MCLYDVSRAKKSETVAVLTETALTTLRTRVAGGDANRTRVMVVASWTDATTPFENVQLRSGTGDGPVMLAVSPDHPFGIARLEDVGTGIMGDLYLSHDGAADVSVSVSVVRLTTNDELK